MVLLCENLFSNWILMSCQPHRVTSGQVRARRWTYKTEVFMRVFTPLRAQELREGRGGRPGLPSLINLPTVSVDVRQHFNNNALFLSVGFFVAEIKRTDV